MLFNVFFHIRIVSLQRLIMDNNKSTQTFGTQIRKSFF